MNNPEDYAAQFQRAPQLWDVFLIPNGLSELNCPAEALQTRTCMARSPAEARQLATQGTPGHYVVDTQPSGVRSPMVLAIRNRGRAANDRAERERWSRDGRDPEVRDLIGGLPRGGGW